MKTLREGGTCSFRVRRAGGSGHHFRVTTVGRDGVLSSYACEVVVGVDELLGVAESRLEATGRELTAAERRHYLGGG